MSFSRSFPPILLFCLLLYIDEKTIPAKYAYHSKLFIVKGIINIQDELRAKKSNEERAQLYYKLANTYFNTSYYGKAWMMFSYAKSSEELNPWSQGNDHWAFFDFYTNSLKYTDYYYRCSDAIINYKKALLLSSNKELGAKSLLALSVCDKISYNYNENKKVGGWLYDKDYVPVYFKQLKKDYRNTEAFKEAVVECPDIRKLVSDNW